MQEHVSRQDTQQDAEVSLLDARGISLLRQAAIGIFACSLLLFLTISLLRQQHEVVPYLATVGLMLTCASVLAMLRHQRPQAAAHLLLWGIIVLITTQAAMALGIRTPSLAAYPIVLMLTGRLLGRRWCLIMLFVVVLCLFALAWGEYVGLLHFNTLRTEWDIFQIHVCISIIGALVSIATVSHFQSQFRETLRTQTSLIAQLAALRNSEDRFERLFRVIPVPLSIATLRDGVTLDANDAWLNMWGYSREEAIGRTSRELGIWADPAAREIWRTKLETDGRLVGHHVVFLSRDGAPHDILAYVERFEHGGQDCLFAAHVDISERLRAEEAIYKLNAELEHRVVERTASLSEALNTLRRAQEELVQSEKLASLGSLVAGIAHELNTPIGNALTVATRLQGDTAELSRQVQADALRRSSLLDYTQSASTATELIERSLTRAADLIHGFKQVAADQAAEWRREFQLDELVNNLISTLRPGLRLPTDSLQVEVPRGIAMDSFPGPLSQVLTNLVQNAVLHGIEDLNNGRIIVRVIMYDDSKVILSVLDNGHGIAPDIIGRIFDPFFTTRLGQGGTGIGLSVVYRLVTTLLGGNIDVESSPEKGTSFIITLPRKAPPNGAAEQL